MLHPLAFRALNIKIQRSHFQGYLRYHHATIFPTAPALNSWSELMAFTHA